MDGKEDLAAGIGNPANSEEKGGVSMKRFVMWLSILAAVAMGILNFAYDDRITPDVVYSMANQRISWNYAGK